MIQICILGVALFYTLFFYSAVKFQQIKKINSQHSEATEKEDILNHSLN